jgi:hypothetical protein
MTAHSLTDEQDICAPRSSALTPACSVAVVRNLLKSFMSQFASQFVAVRRKPQKRWRHSCVAVCGGEPPYPYTLRGA